MDSYRRIGEILTQHGVITQEQLDLALSAHQPSNRRFGEVAVELGMVDEKTITRCLSEQFDLPIANLSKIEPSDYALGLVSEHFAASMHFLPIAVLDNKLLAVVSDPLDLETLQQVAAWTGLRLQVSLASPQQLATKITECYAPAFEVAA